MTVYTYIDIYTHENNFNYFKIISNVIFTCTHVKL